MAKGNRQSKKAFRAHDGPAKTSPPAVADEEPLLVRMEREVEDEFLEPMRKRLAEKIGEVAKSCPKVTCECGRAMQSKGGKPSSVISRFGEISFRVAAFRCRACKKQRRPLEDVLGLEAGRITGHLARLLALLAVVVPFEMAAELAFIFFRVRVSPMTVWRCAQRLGAAVENFLVDQAKHLSNPRTKVPSPAGAPDVVMLGTDGSMVGIQPRAHRQKRGPDGTLPPLPPLEEGRFREVKSAVVFLPEERIETPERRSLVKRALVTCLGDADEIFDRIVAKLHELRWLGPNTVVVLLGDGAEWIWNRASRFTHCVEILDFWHAIEKAWVFARLRHGEGSKKAAQWIHQLAGDLKAGRVDEVIVRLEQLRPANPAQREALEAVIRYYTENKARMRYDEYLAKGYGIGSGAVESCHKQILHARLRQAGMRWSVRGVRNLLALRVLLLNQRWSLLDRLVMQPIAP